MNVPIQNFSEEQKVWYAKLIASAVISDQSVDRMEIDFLKQAISFLGNEGEQKKILGMVQSKNLPPVEKPSNISRKDLAVIFTELILIVIADGNMTTSEVAFLKDTAKSFEFKDSYYSQLMEWSKQGLQWRNSRVSLVNQCETIHEVVEIPKEKEEKEEDENDDKPNNSLLKQTMRCYVCQSKEFFPYFRLKNRTQIIRPNVFGAPTYRGGTPGQDPIDYNRVKIAVCPTCFFASPDSEHFQKMSGVAAAPMPKPLQSAEFTVEWMGTIKERAQFVKPFQKELYSNQRSVATAITLHKLALKSHLALVKYEDEDTYIENRNIVSLFMTLAEFQMSAGKQAEAENSLKQARKRLTSIFSYLGEVESIKSAKMLFFTGLYFKDEKSASIYNEYLRNMKIEKGESLPKATLKVLLGCFQETNRAWQDRTEFFRGKLKGFHKLK